MERCEPTQRFNNHKGFTLFSDEPHHKGLVHLPLSVFLRGGIRSLSTTIRGTTHNGLGAPERLSTTIRGTTHNGIGGSRTASQVTTKVQPPHGHLGSKDPRVTSSQTFNFHESSWRAHRCTKCKRQEHKCSNPSLSNSNKATNAYGGIREEEQWRRNTKNSKIKIY